MSRGHGTAQRLLLAALGDQWIALHDLAGKHPTPARIASLRRALKSLERDGLVELSLRDRRTIRGSLTEPPMPVRVRSLHARKRSGSRGKDELLTRGET